MSQTVLLSCVPQDFTVMWCAMFYFNVLHSSQLQCVAGCFTTVSGQVLHYSVVHSTRCNMLICTPPTQAKRGWAGCILFFVIFRFVPGYYYVYCTYNFKRKPLFDGWVLGVLNIWGQFMICTRLLQGSCVRLQFILNIWAQTEATFWRLLFFMSWTVCDYHLF